MILTNLSKRENISPVDIMKVLSNPNPYFIQEIKELTIGGKLYCQVNPKFIYVSNHNHKRFQSLVDQGANVGVSGEDVTVINT